MQQSTGSDAPGSSLRFEVDVKSSRRLKECSLSDVDAPSFRLYNGVPFEWESHPGKSKDASGGCDDAFSALPPLTPPPRHFCAEHAMHGDENDKPQQQHRYKSSKKKKSYRFKFMIRAIPRTFFTGTPWKMRRQLIPRALSSSPSSSSSSALSRFGSSRSSAVSSSLSSCRGDDDDISNERRAGSTRLDVVCFRVRRIACMLLFGGRG